MKAVNDILDEAILDLESQIIGLCKLISEEHKKGKAMSKKKTRFIRVLDSETGVDNYINVEHISRIYIAEIDTGEIAKYIDYKEAPNLFAVEVVTTGEWLRFSLHASYTTAMEAQEKLMRLTGWKRAYTDEDTVLL